MIYSLFDTKNVKILRLFKEHFLSMCAFMWEESVLRICDVIKRN